MSIFGRILERLTGHAATQPAAAPAATAAPQSAAPTGTPPTGAASPAPATTGRPDDATPGQPGAPMREVDVAAVLDGLAAAAGQKLDWRHSIVDMLKLLGLDSSLEARRELAGELHYGGDLADSAAMNLWLHRQVMQKLAQNGGRVPQELQR